MGQSTEIKMYHKLRIRTDGRIDVTILSSMETSESPIDYVLGLAEVIRNADIRLRRNPMVEPTGVYVQEALDDRGDGRNPLSPRAERFSLEGAVYASTQDDVFALELDLDRRAMHEIACHYISLACGCVRFGRRWPDRTLGSMSSFMMPQITWMDDVLIDGGPDQVFQALALVEQNLDHILVEMEEIGSVQSPWRYAERTRYDRPDWE